MKKLSFSRFWTVTKQEFKETVRSAPFRTITIFFVVIVAVFALLTGLMMLTSGDAEFSELFVTDDPDDIYDSIVAIEDRSGEDILPELIEELPLIRFDKVQLDSEAAAQAVRDGECDAYVVINGPMDFDCIERTKIYDDSVAVQLSATLERIHSVRLLDSHGVSGTDVNDILDARASYTITPAGGYDIGKYIFNVVMVMMMFLVIALYGQMVSTRVATEKSSRTMEILATSVRPAELLCGKVIGVGAAGLMQVSLFVAVMFAILRTMLRKVPELSLMLSGIGDISALDIVWLLLYFVLGFLMVAFMYGGLGSMVSQVEDLSGVSSLPMYLLMIGYLIALTSGSTGETNIVLKIASFIPCWSPIVMFSRMSVEAVPAWEIIVSLVLLALSSVVTAALSARLYRAGMLRYGKPPRLREITAALKASKR